MAGPKKSSARYSRQLLQEKLQGLEPKGSSDRKWLDKEINRIVGDDPRLLPLLPTVVEHLRKGHTYKAATLIAAKLFKVRQRDLEGKPK